jgi:hypothetical protein
MPENKPSWRNVLLTPHLTLSIALSLLLLSGSNVTSDQFFSQSFVPPEINRSLATPSLTNQRVTYKTYSNARYAFRIAYPLGILAPQGESDNGDGQKFVSQDGSATLIAFGSNRLDRSLHDEFQAAQENRAVTYKVLKRDMFVVSGTQSGKIFYQKTLLRGDTFKTFIIEYDEQERATFDAITSRIAGSFVG